MFMKVSNFSDYQMANIGKGGGGANIYNLKKKDMLYMYTFSHTGIYDVDVRTNILVCMPVYCL